MNHAAVPGSGKPRWLPFFAAVLLTALCAAVAGAAELALPTHAIRSSYGGGWECERGFVRRDASCVAVQVPANAFLDSGGSDWQCRRGFVKRGAACQAVRMPANAHADDGMYGAGWRCDRSSGRGWC